MIQCAIALVSHTRNSGYRHCVASTIAVAIMIIACIGNPATN